MKKSKRDKGRKFSLFPAFYTLNPLFCRKIEDDTPPVLISISYNRIKREIAIWSDQ